MTISMYYVVNAVFAMYQRPEADQNISNNIADQKCDALILKKRENNRQKIIGFIVGSDLIKHVQKNMRKPRGKMDTFSSKETLQKWLDKGLQETPLEMIPYSYDNLNHSQWTSTSNILAYNDY